MKDKFIKNLPYATTHCFILLLLYCSKYLNGITGGLYIVVCTLLFIIPNQMRPQSSQKTKKRWTITYIIVAIIELLFCIHKVYITDHFKGTVNFIIHCPFMFTLYIYIIIMLALTFMCYYKFISYISKKVSGGDVAWKHKCPLEKI